MLNEFRFYGKWQVRTDKVVTFTSTDGSGGPEGSVLIAYDAGSAGYSGENVAVQLAWNQPGATTPGDLLYVYEAAQGGNFGVLQARNSFADGYAPISVMLLPKATTPLLNCNGNFNSALGYYPNGGFGFDYTSQQKPKGYTLVVYAASAKDLRAKVTASTTDYSWVALNGEDYSKLDLKGANFAYADLTNTNLGGSNLAGAVFENVVSVSGTTLSGCNLAGANFTNVTISGKNLDGSTLDGATVTGASLAGTLFQVLNGKAASLQNIDFTTAKTIAGAQFTGADLSGSTFNGLDLTGIDFSGCTLAGTKFVGCDLTKATFNTLPTFSTTDSVLTEFAKATLPATLIGLDWSYLDLSYATIVNLPPTLTGLQAVWANLTGLNLTGLKIHNGTFDNATMQNVVLANADLTASSFNTTHFQGDDTTPSATLTNCMLMDCVFDNANLTNVDLTGAYLYGANASLKAATILLAIFADAYLVGLDFSGVVNADFQGVTFSGACLINANFASCNIAPYLGRPTTFANACLQGANFTGATVVGCNLFDAAVASAAGSINVTITLRGQPITQSQAYAQATLGLPAVTNITTVCPNGSKGPCTVPQLVAPNPPTAWP
ncbi:MAG: pentapeptide repeat-containing protein [Gemmatimonadota bacterium]